MKAFLISALLIGLSGNLYGQGQLVLNNIPNTSTSTSATANGLFWLSTGGAPVLINQDFNAAFYAGTDSSSLFLISTILLSNGTGLGDNAGGPGTFFDPSGAIYTFQSPTSVFVEIQAWTGNFNSYATAVIAGAPAAQSPIFGNRLGVPPGPPGDLEGMPAMVLSSIPEPSTFALAALGGVCALLLRRCRKKCWYRNRTIKTPMKKLILSALLFGVTVSAKPQGYIYLDNINNSSPDPLATTSGLFWLSTGGMPVLINQDFNAAFYGGATSNSLSLIKRFLLSDGTARNDNAWGPGYFLDPTGAYSYPILGSGLFAFFQIQAWTGNFNSYAAALNAGAPAAQSPVFVNPVCAPPCSPPDLINMPAMVLSGIPEPSAFALGALGGLFALLLGRDKPPKRI